MNKQLTTAEYLALIDRIGYPRGADVLRERILKGDAGARFAVYSAALRKGLVQKDGPALASGETVTCACGATYNGASRSMQYLHAGH